MFAIALMSSLWFTASNAYAGETPPCLDDAAILLEARSSFPSRYDSLMRLRQTDPLRYKQLIHNTLHTLDDPALVAAQEKLGQAEARLDAITAQLAKASPTARAALESQLVDAAETVVDLRIAAKRVRLQGLREEESLVNQDLMDMARDRESLIDALIDQKTP
jgi:hypothetical protein